VSFALPEALFFTGIDWATETHAVCVTDAGGKITAEFTIEHSAVGIALLVSRLARYGEAGVMPVAIERPDGRLAGLLLEAGHPVVPVSPNAIKAWRDGEVLSGAKSDAGDAAVIAEYLRLRAHRLKTAAPYSDETLALRAAVRARGDLVEMRVAATNQLSALLEAHWPAPRRSSPTSSRRSAWSSWPATRPRPPPRTSARSGWPPSWSSTATPAAGPPPSCSPACAPPRRAPAAKHCLRRSATSCSPPSACSLR
jgi:hypothetical protein